MSDRTPLVSVLMPAYNAARFLRPAVESILNQTFDDFEFVIVDDGSTDDTGEILAECAARDPRIRVLTNERNLRIVASLNRGLDACRGTYVARMDADDVALPDRLAKQVAALARQPDLAVLGGALTYIDADGKKLNVTRHCTVGDSLLRKCPLLHPTVVLRRAVFARHGLRYRTEFREAEDYYLWLETSRHGRLGAIDDVVLQYRVSGSAARMTRVKRILWHTLRAKVRGAFGLGIRPTARDVLRFAAECALLAVPTALLRWIYLRRMFGKNADIAM